MKTNYSLIDIGNKKRLERFGDIVVQRAAMQAEWKPNLERAEWKKADLFFDGEEWRGDDTETEFFVNFDDVVFCLKPMSMGQVGVFPEQARSWKWLEKIIEKSDKSFKVLNGFAYTGGSTMFSSYKNSEVCHVDASKASVNRAKVNAELSGKQDNNIRYIVDDVMTFMEKEVRRGNKYNGFIFDPPAFGRGGKGKTWKLNRDIGKLFSLIDQLSDGTPEFVLISAHDPSMCADDLKKMISGLSGVGALNIDSGDFIMNAESGRYMHNGYYARWSRL